MKRPHDALGNASPSPPPETPFHAFLQFVDTIQLCATNHLSHDPNINFSVARLGDRSSPPQAELYRAAITR